MNISPALSTFLDLLPDAARCPDRETVEALAAEAPWFVLPAAVMLRRASDLSADEVRRLSARVAINTPGSEAIAGLIDRDSELWQRFYPDDDTPARPDTTDAIATFLDTYGHGSSPEDDALLERLIFNPQPDYASVLEATYGPATDAPADDRTARIDSFLANPGATPPAPPAQSAPPAPPASPASPAAPAPAPASAPTAPASAPTAPGDSPLSESLAKIYIRQRRYDKAYEIISNLNLNFPEKSAYFADQLRFLQKLMLNSRYAASGEISTN